MGALLVGLTLLGATLAPAEAATVKISVNGQPITDIQISQRVALKRIERSGGQKEAVKELVDEALEVQEAQRLGFTISDSDVDDAFLQVARNLKMSASNLSKVLSDNGVALQTMRDRLKANLAWQKVTAAAVSSRVQLSEADIDAQAKAKLTASESFDYILKEVLFITGSSDGSAAARTAQANQYRKAFKGCDTAVDETLKFRDAAVRDVGRRHATQLPDAIAKELSTLSVGGITKPRVVQGGVSMLAICAKEASNDTTFIANELRQDAGNGALKKEADKYLADLRAKAQIVYS